MNRANKGASTNILHILLDIFVTVSALAITFKLGNWNFSAEEQSGLLTVILVFTVLVLLSNRASYLYNSTLFFYTDRILKKTMLSFLISVLATVGLVRFVCPQEQGMRFYLCFVAVSFALISTKAFLLKPIMRAGRKEYSSHTAFLGSRNKFTKFRNYLNNTTITFEDVGYIAVHRDDYLLAPGDYIGCAEDLEDLIREYHIDQIYVGQDPSTDLRVAQQYLDLCMDMGVTVRMVLDFYQRRGAKTYVSSIGTYPVVTYHTIAMNTSTEMVKRVMDVIGGFVGLVLTSPIMLLTAIAIKLDSPGPILFKQTRVGKNGREFQIYKFRSMYIDAEQRKKELMKDNEISGGIMFKMKDDPRITKVGKIIRKLSIDELPQFFNVLGGSMSLVGTRPPTLDEVEKYKTIQWRRISIKPGLTGMWQVSGRSSVQDFEDIVRLDVEYIDNWSIWLDIRIILKTVWVVLRHADAY